MFLLGLRLQWEGDIFCFMVAVLCFECLRPHCTSMQVSYRSYWTRELLVAIYEHGANISIKELSDLTGIRTDDVVSTLQSLGLVRYWKGDHILVVHPKTVEDLLRKGPAQPPIAIDETRVHYTPYISCVGGSRPK